MTVAGILIVIALIAGVFGAINQNWRLVVAAAVLLVVAAYGVGNIPVR